jgi:Major Facilitator Superfamily
LRFQEVEQLVNSNKSVIISRFRYFWPWCSSDLIQTAELVALVDQGAFSERLGHNERYAAIGNAAAAGVMGVCAYSLGDQIVFCSPRRSRSRHLAALASLREADFHLSNAAMLPIAAAAVTKRAESEAGLIIAACIVGPQLITALLSPWAGRAAEVWGRRPILLLGFSALPIRGILLACTADPYLIIAIQLFDGLGAAVFGVLSPLIVADVTRDTGRYTTALGLVGLVIGGGATLSTALAGLVADHLGVSAAFLSLAAVGLSATALVWTLMPETRPAVGSWRRSAVPFFGA